MRVVQLVNYGFCLMAALAFGTCRPVLPGWPVLIEGK